MNSDQRSVLQSLLDAKEFDKTIEYCTRQIELDHSNYLFYAARGRAYIDIKKYDEAIVDLTSAIDINPLLGYAYTNRAQAFLFSNKDQLSVNDFEHAIQLDTNFDFYDLLGLAYSYLGNHKRAVEFYSLYLDKHFDKVVYLWRAESYIFLDDTRNANIDYENVLQLEVSDIEEIYDPINALVDNNCCRKSDYKSNQEHFNIVQILENREFITNPQNSLQVELKNISAVYVLEFDNGEYYIGQSKKVISRLRQHRKTYEDIKNIFIKPKDEGYLVDEENKTIALFEEMLLRIRNVLQVDFRNIFDSDCQKNWINDLTFNYISGERYENAKVREKYKTQYNDLKCKSFYNRLIPMIALYIQNTIPNYIAGEYNYWSITCMPKFLIKENCISRININGIPVFSINSNPDETLRIMFFVSKLPFLKYLKAQNSLKPLFVLNDTMRFEIRNMFDQSEGDELTIFIEEPDFMKAMDNEVMLSAMRLFNLRMMNKSGINKDYNRRQFHCLDLADAVLDEIYK